MICPSSISSQPRSLRAAPTILVVEDEILVRLWVTDELRANGFTVLEAANGDAPEQGRHDELMALGGRYRRMFDLQAARFMAGATDDATEEGEQRESA